jgi:hypothetical protein
MIIPSDISPYQYRGLPHPEHFSDSLGNASLKFEIDSNPIELALV